MEEIRPILIMQMTLQKAPCSFNNYHGEQIYDRSWSESINQCYNTLFGAQQFDGST